MAEMIKFYNSSGVIKYASSTDPLPTTATLSGSISATLAPPTAVYNDAVNVTTAGTAVSLGSSQSLNDGVVIKANEANTGNIYVGDSSVSSSNGLVLEAGESVMVGIDDVSKVYIDSDNDGEGITYVGG